MRISNYGIALLAIFIFNLPDIAIGQSSGWELLQDNQFLQSKSQFEKTLAQNPHDEDALCGMIFISEVLQDQLSYRKYTNQIIESTWRDEYFALFKHLYQGRPEKILRHRLAPELLVQPTLAQADSLFINRNFDRSIETLKEVAQDLNWSVIGPFDNVAGSGHIEQQPLEIESHKPYRTYYNENGLAMKWVNRHLRQPNGEVYFNENLSYLRSGTYYANTFINLPKEQTIQLRVARNTPMKVWLNDDLVLDKNYNIKYSWDNEIIELTLKKGKHRILIKSSPYLEEGSKSDLYLGFNDHYDEERISNGVIDEYGGNYFNNRKYSSRGNQTAGFGLRITDAQGKLIKGLKSDFAGKNKTKKYEPKILDRKWIRFFEDKIKADSLDIKNHYLLTKMYLKMELGEEGEEWFAKEIKTKKQVFYFRYLFAKILAANDKGEQAEALLSEINFQKIPVVAMLVNYLQKIDRKNDTANYHSKIRQILHFSPTHKEALFAYLNWLKENGKEEEKKEYIRSFLASYPNAGYKDLFLKFLTAQQNEDEEIVKFEISDREKDGIKAIEKIKTRFNHYDYLTAIKYYKKKRNYRKVEKLYNELITRLPYRPYYLREKADYILERGRYAEAIELFETALEINPYHARTLEKLGDAHLKNQEENKALQYFESSLAIDRAAMKGNFVMERIRKKMEGLSSKESPKQYFQDFTTKKIQVDQGWVDRYPLDESVILMYNIQASLNESNRLNYHQKLWIKILNPAGANYWTEADFSFLGELGLVKVIKEDGTEVTPSRNWNLVVFQNLQPGDIIHIEGFSNGDMTREIPNEMYHMAWLSMEVPIYKSVFELILPKEKQLNYVCNKIDCDPKIEVKEKVKLYTWENHFTPKNEHENAVLDDMDKFSWVMLSTQEDWGGIVKWYQRKTYRRLEANYDVKNQLAKIITKEMSKEEQVKAVYNYLTKGITYSYVSFLNSNYVPKKPSQTICGGIGDCKDVASLMIAMLRELEIEAYYVLVRTKNYTQQEPRPSVLAFDHVVVGYRLENEPIRFMDLTTDYFSSNALPEFDNDQWALLIKPKQTRLFRLPNDQIDANKNFLKIKTMGQIVDERNLEMKVTMSATGVIAGVWREKLNNKTTNSDHQLFLTESLSSAEFDHLKIEDFSFENLNKIDTILDASIDLKAFHHLEKVSDFQILQIPILHPITTRTALFGEVRFNNLALGELFNLAPSEQLIDLQIPSGFELLEVPNNVNLESEFGSYHLYFKRTLKGIQIQRELIFKKHFITSEEYAEFKRFYLQLLDGDRTKLAIRKRAVIVRQ